MYMNNIVKISNSVILLLRSMEEICMFVNVAFIAAEVIKEEYVEAFCIWCVFCKTLKMV